MSLTKKERDALPDSDFAVPGKRELPIHDEKHARLAWDMVDRTADLTDEERTEARERIRHRAKELGIDTEDWKAEAMTDCLLAESVIMHAMSLNVPDTPDHPNKHPFKGILTRIGKPSDAAPTGSGKKRVMLTPAAAKKALPTLLGMAVDLKSDLSGHDVKKKVGIITDANIKGDALWIEGFLYAADFPDEVARIQSEKDELGFSWEVKNIYVKDTNADPLVITGCIFTGAAILYKDEAAYTTTQLAAQAEEKDMSKEILDEMKKLGDSVNETIGKVNERLDKIEASSNEITKTMQAGAEHRAKVEPHAAALESCAAAMEKDGLGGHPTRGHVKACRAMAEHMRAEAAMGRLASEWPGFSGFQAAAEPDPAKKAADEAKDKEIKELKDQVSSQGTKIKDLEAAATRNSQQADRKTLTPQITALLARGNISLPEGEKKISLADVNRMLANSSLDPVQRMELKGRLEKAGLIAA